MISKKAKKAIERQFDNSRFDFSTWETEDFPPFSVDFSLEKRPNVYGVHEHGEITLYLPNFKFSDQDITIQKICDCIWHEAMHNAINKATEDHVEWQKQDRAIGLVEKMMKG